MYKTVTITYLILILSALSLSAQLDFRVMSYNAENLFDTTDDPSKDDSEYLPSGNRHWTHGRYYQKLQQIARVICASGEWSTPALVGLCEVESDSTLIHLLNRTPLRQQQYRYCMTHGQDTRGINTALLYQRDKFGYIGHAEHPVVFSRKKHKHTRNILHVWGKLITSDTLDIFVCHFPSRYGGEKESETDRFDAARTLRNRCDSLYNTRQTAQIIIMGDFNDTPEDKSIRQVLSAIPYKNKLIKTGTQHLHPTTNTDSLLLLCNLFADSRSLNYPGSHKYQGEWSQLDQIIVSGNLTDPDSPMHFVPGSNRIFNAPFLLTPDKTWRGERPKRTHYGFKYEGGYSDHLPLIADFLLSLPIQP